MSTPTVIQTSKILPNSSPAMPPSQSRVDAMAASIKDAGILDPILVQKVGHRYEITPGGGMVRWLAATKLGLDIVPVRVLRLDNEDCAAASLITNMSREQVDPEEKVANLERLIEHFGENAAALVMEQLPDLREAGAVIPDLQARINALLVRCKINSE